MFTPRHMRRGSGTNRSGAGKAEKSRAFRQAKKTCDQFIHQSASRLESATFSKQYQKFRELCGFLGSKALRKGA